jgi:hypothetical protein
LFWDLVIHTTASIVGAGAAALMEERMKKRVEKEKTYQVLLNYLSMLD